MTYLVRFIEILAISKENERDFLQISMNIGDSSKALNLELDQYTADNIQSIVKFENSKQKYRLSFQYNWDPVNQVHRSYVTQVNVNRKETIGFSCSEAFIENIKSLKELTSLDDLQNDNEKVDEPKENLQILPERVEKKQSWKNRRRILYPISFVLLSIPIIMSISTVLASNLLDPSTPTKVEEETFILNGKEIVNKVASEETKKIEESVEAAPFTRPTVKLSSSTSYQLAENEVALTFDDGPSKYTKEIVDILAAEDVGGTFFFIGENVQSAPEAVKYVDDHQFSIGNHTLTHPSLPSMSIGAQNKELSETNNLIQDIISKPVTLFRPPYGAKNDNVEQLVNDLNMKMVLWNGDTRDWENRNVDKIIEYVKTSDSAGTIYLFHELSATTEALPEIIKYLKEQGLTIVNLE